MVIIDHHRPHNLIQHIECVNIERVFRSVSSSGKKQRQQLNAIARWIMFKYVATGILHWSLTREGAGGCANCQMYDNDDYYYYILL